MKKNNLTRREFLKRTAGAVAAPYVITSTALGAGSIPPASERVTLGYIGVGGRGNALAYQFLRTPGAQSVAVCDAFTTRQKSTAKAFDDYYGSQTGKGSYKGCAMYGDFRKLLAREDIDAVIIATPDHWHVPAALAAVRAGKDVYVEKPLGVAVVWNQALREAVQNYGAVFQYGTQQRSSRNFRFACELARNGKLGKLERIDAWCPGMAAPGTYESTSKGGGSTKPIPVPPELDYDMWIGPAPMSPYTKDRCTTWGCYHVYDNALGFIAGWGAHPLDIAQWGNDSDDTVPVEYEGTGKIPTEGIFDTISDWDIHCRYANGIKMHFMNTRTALPVVEAYRKFNDHGTTFFGSEGWVSVDRGAIYASDPALLEIKLKPGEIHLYESNHHYKNFVDCVKSRARTVSPVEAAVQSDIISHLSDICIRMGRKIKWDPAKEEIIGDEIASRMLNRALRSPWRL
jgi:predicted dehydrogenase